MPICIGDKNYAPKIISLPKVAPTQGSLPPHLDQQPKMSLLGISPWNIGLSIEILTSKKPFDRETKVLAFVRLAQGIVGYLYAIILFSKIIAAIIAGGFSIAALTTPFGLLIVGLILIGIEIGVYSYSVHQQRMFMADPLFKHKDILTKKFSDLTKEDTPILLQALATFGVTQNQVESELKKIDLNFNFKYLENDSRSKRVFQTFVLKTLLLHFKKKYLSYATEKEKFQVEVNWQKFWISGPDEEIKKQLLSIDENTPLTLEKMQEFLEAIEVLQRKTLAVKVINLIACLLCLFQIFFTVLDTVPTEWTSTVFMVGYMVFNYGSWGLDLYSGYKTKIPSLT